MRMKTMVNTLVSEDTIAIPVTGNIVASIMERISSSCAGIIYSTVANFAVLYYLMAMIRPG